MFPISSSFHYMCSCIWLFYFDCIYFLSGFLIVKQINHNELKENLFLPLSTMLDGLLSETHTWHKLSYLISS